MYVVKRTVDFRDLEMITHEQIFEETNKYECNNLIGFMNVVGTKWAPLFVGKRLLMKQSSACVFLGEKTRQNKTKIRVLILLANGCR